ncbi:MAG: hypothetical protein OTI35_06265, partial [Sulfitobacter sp.]|nr:hypothetical protein [Sulfitobacter sp.]
PQERTSSKFEPNTSGSAAMINILGDRWNWRLVREAFYDASRFTEFRCKTYASVRQRREILVSNQMNPLLHP